VESRQWPGQLDVLSGAALAHVQTLLAACKQVGSDSSVNTRSSEQQLSVLAAFLREFLPLLRAKLETLQRCVLHWSTPDQFHALSVCHSHFSPLSTVT